MMTKKARFNNQLKRNTIERQKLYKAKKRWLVAGISALATTGIITGGQLPKTHAYASTNHIPTQKTIHHHNVNGQIPSKHGLQFMTYKQYIQQKQREEADKSKKPKSNKPKYKNNRSLQKGKKHNIKPKHKKDKSKKDKGKANTPKKDKSKNGKFKNSNPKKDKSKNGKSNLDPNRPIALPKDKNNGGSKKSKSPSGLNPNQPIGLPTSKKGKKSKNNPYGSNTPISSPSSKKSKKSKSGKGHKLQSLSNGKSLKYHGRTVTRIDTKGHFRHLRLLKPVGVYDDVLSLKSNKVGSLHSNDVLPTLKIWRAFKVHPKNGGKPYIRYEVKLHGMHYFVTANKKYTQNAYITKRHVKNMGIKTIRNIAEYKSKHYSPKTKIKNIPKGKTMNVSKMVSIGHHGYKQTRFIIKGGHYVTANKNFVRATKSSSKNKSSKPKNKSNKSKSGSKDSSPKKSSMPTKLPNKDFGMPTKMPTETPSSSKDKGMMPSGGHIIPSKHGSIMPGSNHRSSKSPKAKNKANYRYVLNTSDLISPNDLNNITHFGNGFNSGGGTRGELIKIMRKKNVDGRTFDLINDKEGQDNGKWIYSGDLGRSYHSKAHSINLKHLWYDIINKYSEKHKTEFENQMKNESLGFINESRMKNSVMPLKEENWLDNVAKVRAKQLASNFSHYDKNNLVLNAIDAKNLGYYPSYDAAHHHISENIASAIIDKDGKEATDPTTYRELDGNGMGFASNNNMMYHDAHSGWGHRENILDNRSTAIGIGTYFSPKTHYFYLVEDFSNANNHD